MKRIFTLLLLSSCLAFQLIAQEACLEGIFPLQEDTKYEITHYNKKGKVSSIAQNHINFVEAAGNGVEAQVKSTILDDDGEEIHQTVFTITCRDGVSYVDIANVINPALLAGNYGAEMEISGDGFAFPQQMSIGQDLPPANTDISINSGPVAINMSMNTDNRRVEAKETITTPAGTFECYKVSFDMNIKMMVSRKTKVTQWVAPGVGLVKEETYADGGKLLGTSLLTSFSK